MRIIIYQMRGNELNRLGIYEPHCCTWYLRPLKPIWYMVLYGMSMLSKGIHPSHRLRQLSMANGQRPTANSKIKHLSILFMSAQNNMFLIAKYINMSIYIRLYIFGCCRNSETSHHQSSALRCAIHLDRAAWSYSIDWDCERCIWDAASRRAWSATAPRAARQWRAGIRCPEPRRSSRTYADSLAPPEVLAPRRADEWWRLAAT